MKKEKRTCKICGQEFRVSPSVVKIGGGKFCSKECWNKRNPQINIQCLTCGKSFEDWKSNGRKFCSPKCGYLQRRFRVKKICIQCGKKYEVINYEKESIFCSPQCKGQYKHKTLSETKTCKFCSKQFTISISNIKRGKGIYCSRKCMKQCPDYKQHIMETLINNRMNKNNIYPNKSEVKLNGIMQELKLPYKFVGNGEVWIAGLNPDFINVNGQKKIVEVFGEYWHQGKNVPYFRTESGRKKVFAEYGYETLVIWTNELRQPEILKQKILNFNHMEAIRCEQIL